MKDTLIIAQDLNPLILALGPQHCEDDATSVARRLLFAARDRLAALAELERQAKRLYDVRMEKMALATDRRERRDRIFSDDEVKRHMDRAREYNRVKREVWRDFYNAVKALR